MLPWPDWTTQEWQDAIDAMPDFQTETHAGAVKAWDTRGRNTEPQTHSAPPVVSGNPHRTLEYDHQAKRWNDPSGEMPNHIAAMKIPPAWQQVKYDPNPNAALHVTGVDSKGRRQAIYNQNFVQQQAAAKFSRVNELNGKFKSIQAEVKSDLHGEHKEEASALRLIMNTGIRPGSASDTGGAVKAYGATTLEGRHVVGTDPTNLRLQFVGKKGVAVDVPVEDTMTAKDLIRRRSKAGENGPIFGTTAGKLLSYTQSKDGGGFKTKDLRTLLATRTAAAMVKSLPKPKNPTQYKKSLRTVARAVAAKLGNTPAIALKSYINPAAFASWVI